MDRADALIPGDCPKPKTSWLVAIAAAACLFGAAGEAQASFVLDTGTPAGSSQLVLSTAQSFAAEFSIGAGVNVTTLSAYLTPNTGNANTFEFEIFSNSPSFIGARSPTLVYSTAAMVTATSSTPGWDSVAVNWTPTTGGNYWLAILEPNVGTTLDVQSETSTGTGTAPALAFASTNTPGTRYATFGTGHRPPGGRGSRGPRGTAPRHGLASACWTGRARGRHRETQGCLTTGRARSGARR